jgi:rhodanese-related sulfurtransferase
MHIFSFGEEENMPYQKEFVFFYDCVDKDELLQRMEERANMVIVDTIGTYAGNKYKIRGAMTIPFPDVIDRRQELAPYDEIIIYCKHERCVASKKKAIGLMLLNVPNVKVYEGGIDEWVAHNLPVEEYHF